jgi:hypothetical protein
MAVSSLDHRDHTSFLCAFLQKPGLGNQASLFGQKASVQVSAEPLLAALAGEEVSIFCSRCQMAGGKCFRNDLENGLKRAFGRYDLQDAEIVTFCGANMRLSRRGKTSRSSSRQVWILLQGTSAGGCPDCTASAAATPAVSPMGTALPVTR